MTLKLDTGDHPPIKQRPYKTQFAERPKVDQHINGMLEAGVISPSNSPWASPIVIVPKKDGTKRVCVDYRKGVNKVLRNNSYPLPDISDILSSLHQAKYFSYVDLKSGYWQVEVEPEDRQKTAFVCHAGLFEFNVMPFGLSSAPPIFQELMNKVLGQAMYKYAIAYLDDVIIYSSTFQEHLNHLAEVFSKFRSAGLKLKMSKCQFLMKEINYLGHVISKNGISPDPEKTRAISELRPPQNVREVRSVVGMASYYRKFIDHFSEIVKPLTELTKKTAKFIWTSEHDRAFETLKSKLVSAPVLAHPDLSQPYKLSTDASLHAVGAVLTQDTPDGERVIQYLSKKLSEGQKKWSTIEREAYAIVFAINKLRHYLLGSKFTVFTDHKPLRSLFTSEMKNARIQRWAIMLEEYGCQIEYRQGKNNVPADMLSRVVSENSTDEVVGVAVLENVLPPKQYTEDHVQDRSQEVKIPLLDKYSVQAIQDMQRKDPVLREIFEQLEQSGQSTTGDFVLDEKLLYHMASPVRSDTCDRLQLAIPAELVEGVLEQMHASEYGGGHLGLDRTYDKIRTRYFWQNMYRDVVEYLARCDICKARKLKKAQLPMQEMPIPEFPFDIIGIDTCGPFPESAQGKKYVVTVVDHFSSWPEAYATKDKSAETIASVLVEHILPRHSCPRVLISDRGTEFVNGVIELLLKKMKVCHLRTSPYHPQTNGKTERFHRFMNDVLAKYVQQDHHVWDTYIQAMLMAYRTSVNDTTRYTPFFLMHGRDPVLPLDTLLRPKLKYMGEDYVPSMLQRLCTAFGKVKKNMASAREKNKRLIDRKATNAVFEPGDKVFYYNPAVTPGEFRKLNSPWKPYYCVVERISPVLYKIRNQLTGLAKVVHGENLQPAHPDNSWDKDRDKYENFDRVETKPSKVHKEPTRVQPMRACRLVQPLGQLGAMASQFQADDDGMDVDEFPQLVETVDPRLDTEDPTSGMGSHRDRTESFSSRQPTEVEAEMHSEPDYPRRALKRQGFISTQGGNGY